MFNDYEFLDSWDSPPRGPNCRDGVGSLALVIFILVVMAV